MEKDKEKFKAGQENGVDIITTSQEQLEKIRKSPENNIETLKRDVESRTEKARSEALKNARSSEIKSKDSEKLLKQSATIRTAIGKKHREESYKKTLKQVQQELSLGSKLFSQFTHNAIVEKTSETIGSTIARPNAVLSGAFFSFIATLLIYVISKNIGYTISGSETIAAFAIGWLFGLIFDYLKIIITGKNS